MKKRIIKYLVIKLKNLLNSYSGAALPLPRFRNSPENLTINYPRIIAHPERITIGNNVSLGPGCWLMPITGYPSGKMKHPDGELNAQKFDPYIYIGNNVMATANLQVFAQNSVTIEDDVMFASNILVNDGSHGYQSGTIPYKYQPVFRIDPVVIKKGCWIGQNVVIMPGVTIGEFTIIGANSVVTKSIPPHCIAAGGPAVVIKRWDMEKNEWISEK